MARPERPELRSDRMIGRGKKVWGRQVCFGEGVPIAALPLQNLGAKPAELHIVGWCVLRMQLQAVALEQLDIHRAPFDRLCQLAADRVAEDRQPTMLSPECADPPIDAVADRRCFGKAARCC